MKRPFLIFLIPITLFTVFLLNYEHFKTLAKASEDSFWPLVVVVGVSSVLLLSVFFSIVFYGEEKRKKKIEELEEKIDAETNPKYAKRLRHKGKTSDIGDKAIVLDEDNWVVVQWNKKEGWITIFMPPNHENRINRINKQWFNGKFEEVQEVRIEDLPRIS